MIALLRAYLELRWRLQRNALRAALRSGDRFRVVERWSGLATILLIVVLAVPMIAGATAAAGVAGFLVASGRLDAATLPVAARIAIATVLVIVVVARAIVASRGGGIATDRLLLLPIPRRHLHLLHYLGGLGDPWPLALLLMLLALPCGLAAGGLGSGAWVIVVAGLAVATGVLAVEALAVALATLLGRGRHAQWLTILALGLLSMAGLIPMAVQALGWDPVLLEASIGSLEALGALYAPILEAVLAGRLPLARLAALVALACGLFALSQAAYRRLLAGGGGGMRRRAGGGEVSDRRLPGVSAPAMAVLRAQVTALARTGAARLALVQCALMSGVLAVFASTRGDRLAWLDLHRDLAIAFGVVGLAALGLLPFMLNQYAIDGRGLTLMVLQPIADEDLLSGKAATWTVLLLAAAPVGWLAGTGIAGPPTARALWILALVTPTAVAAALVLVPVCACLAALFPRQVDLRRLTRNQPHPLAMLLGLLLTGLSIAVPLFVVVTVYAYLGRPLVALVALLLWTTVAYLVHRLFRLAARQLWESRRMRLLGLSQGR